MSDTPITTLDEAKAALDQEIANSECLLRIYRADEEKARNAAAPYATKLYALRRIRERMDLTPESPAVIKLAERVAEQAA